MKCDIVKKKKKKITIKELIMYKKYVLKSRLCLLNSFVLCSFFTEEKHIDINSTTLSQESSDTTLSVTSPETSAPKPPAPDTPTQAPICLLRSAPRRLEPPMPPELLEVPRCLPTGHVEQRKVLVEMCVRALFLCLNRFPQHYKSLYRLAHLYACSKTHKVKHTHTDYKMKLLSMTHLYNISLYKMVHCKVP